MLSFNLLRRLPLSSYFKIKNFKCFHSRAMTNEVQLLENSPSGRNYLLPWNTQSLWNCLPCPWRDSVSWFPLEIWLACLCSVDTPFRLLDETRAYWLQNLSLKFFRRECDKLCVWILKCELCIWSSHLGFLPMRILSLLFWDLWTRMW